MNYLISAYSVNPYKGSEDSIGWNWVLQYEKNYKEGDRIILLTKKFNEKDTRKGLKEFNIQHLLQHGRWSARWIDVLCGDEGKKASIKLDEIVI